MKFVAQLSKLKVAETYIKVIKIIIPQKATPNYHNIFVNVAKFYKQGGVTSMVAPDLNSAQQAFEQGTKMPFRMTDDHLPASVRDFVGDQLSHLLHREGLHLV